MLTIHTMSTLSLSRNVVLFGSAAAAFVAGVYVIWGPNHKKRTKQKGRTQDRGSGVMPNLSVNADVS